MERKAGSMERIAGGLEGNVAIEITGGQGQIKNCHEGRCYLRNGHIYVLFSETLTEDGKQGATFSSRLKISENEVILRRSIPSTARDTGATEAQGAGKTHAAEVQGNREKHISESYGTDGKAGAHVMEFVYRIQAEEDIGCMVDYPTPYGLMRLEIRTRKLEIRREDKRMEIQIEYTMLQGGQEINRDKLHLQIYSVC
ncbi:MAG: DUF1934 domain-containing protein [Lachnospiraceae bacterium]|nr:DUF1934 domain-containing protein [Lachnospiraceae bacterium]MBR4608431.1 DUF1934 domain-containing protein [Lachnospiraceae bacterium]MBR6150938.1 DUF1934 domain-containing protein [Lachnospiraceae bacterium]